MINNCPICGCNENMLIGSPKTNSISKKFIHQKYFVAKCKKCTTYYVFPKITFSSNHWEELYNSDYFNNQSNWLIKKRDKELKLRFDMADKLLIRESNKINFLDIGTGEGKALIEARRRGWEALGLDIVDNRSMSAKTSEIKFYKTNLMDIDLGKNYYDFIYVDSVLEHVLNPMDYLIKINKILKPGGIVYIGVPNEDCLFNDIRKIVFMLIGRKNLSEKIKPFDSPYHVVGFNKTSLTYALNHSGFKLKQINNIGRKFDFLGSSPKQKAFWISLFFLLPIEAIAKLVKRDVYFEAYISKY